MSEVNISVMGQMLDDIAIVVAGKSWRFSVGHNRNVYQESFDRLKNYGTQLIAHEVALRSYKGSVEYQNKRKEAFDELAGKAIIYGTQPESGCQSEEQPV